MQFAKAMIIHHQGAVEMAREYHANADARNGFLGLMNVDITTDQTQEIALMRRVIAAYPGDADAVRVDPSMVHGMEGTKHGVHGGGHAAAAASTARFSGPSTAKHPHDGAHHGHHRQGHHHAHGQHDGHAGHGQNGHHGAHGGSAAAPKGASPPRPSAGGAPPPGGAARGRGRRQGHQYHQH